MKRLKRFEVKKRLHAVRKGVQEYPVPNGPRLLLIDDEPALADFVATAARLSGFEPEVAANEQGFHDCFDKNRPDVVVLDLGMPGTDGVEFLRYLSGHDFAGPVLIVSGFDRRVLESAVRLGSAMGLDMAGTIEKPVRLDDLEQQLTALKGRVRA